MIIQIIKGMYHKITVLAICSLLVISACAQDEKNTRGYIVEVGDMAPEFSMKLIDGSSISLSELKGKVVMLQFTASWCGVCRKEMPHIEEEIWQVLKERNDFALYAIDIDEPLEVVKTYIEKVGISYPIGLDPGREIFARYAQREAGVTRNIIIDRSGKIIYLTRLFNQEEFEGMKEVIFQELGKISKQ